MDSALAPQNFFDWLPEAAVQWLIVVGLLSAVVLLISLSVVLGFGWRDGLDRTLYRFVSRLASAFQDLVRISPRRVWALTRLTVQESVRRRGLVGFVLFLFVLSQALWFLDTQSPDPAVLYISSIQWATTILVLVTVLLLSALSLPNDLKNKTIFTIVTKPVRPSEIVLGHILGIVAVGTLMLAVMGVCAYAFVYRALDHTHELSEEDLSPLDAPDRADVRAVRQGRTSTVRHHRHRATVDEDGTGATNVVQGHWHRISSAKRGGRTEYAVGSPLGQFRARVPMYGKLRFKDRFGNAAERGTNIGEWTHHRYVEGGSLAAAIWTFDDVRAERFSQGLRIDLNILVFRTHKGDIERGIAGSLVLRNPRTQKSSAPYNFIAQEFVIDPHLLPRKLTDAAGKPIDLFDDLVDNGRLEIVLQCLERGQFLGMGSLDLYLLAREGSVAGNFVKSYLGVWLLMTLIASFGVMWSTFLNAAVAILATLGTLFMGFFVEFIRKLSNNEIDGGATFESLVRIVQQKNLKVPLEDTWTLRVVGGMDEVVRWGLGLLARLSPDLRIFSTADYLAQGYDIRLDDLAIQGATMLGFALPAFVFGYLCFKFREVAQ